LETTGIRASEHELASHAGQLVAQWGLQFYLLPRSHAWRRDILSGRWEAAQRAFFFESVKRLGCDFGVDVGANCGIYTLLMAQQASMEQVYAIEPCEPYFSMLCEAILLQGVDLRCTLFRLAASDIRARKRMRVMREELPCMNHLVDTQPWSNAELEPHTAEMTTADTVPLDALLALEGRKIALKIDVEGHEAAVVAGATSLLTNNDCFLQVECFDDEAEERLRAMGYVRIFQVDKDRYFVNGRMRHLFDDLGIADPQP